MDKHPLTVKVESTTLDDSENYTLYVITVERGGLFDTWKVQRRYSEFATLQAQIKELCPIIDLPLPPKKMFGSMDKAVIAERQSTFRLFLDLLQENVIVMWQPEVLRFFNCEGPGAQFRESFEKALLSLTLAS